MPLSFTKMNENDLYNADQVTNANFDYLSDNVLPSSAMSKADYDNLAKIESDRLYAVVDGATVELFLGTIKISGGSSAKIDEMTALMDGLSANGLVGMATHTGSGNLA